MCSQTKLLANRLNAQKSTGPKTPEGKVRSSLNSVTHAAYCKVLLLPGESKEHFEEVRQTLHETIDPRDAVELTLFERLLSAKWKLYRIAREQRNASDPKTQAAVKELSEMEQVRELERALGGRRSRSSWHARLNVNILAQQEQRLENQFYKALRELRQWRAAKAKEAKMKTEANDDGNCDTDASISPLPVFRESPALTPLPVRRERLGEGSELNADELEMASVTREPSPQPSPGVPGEGANANSQNEPNDPATESSPSPAPTHSPCDPALTPPPPSALHALDPGSA